MALSGVRVSNVISVSSGTGPTIESADYRWIRSALIPAGDRETFGMPKLNVRCFADLGLPPLVQTSHSSGTG
jgi:hypothetical protein